MNIPHKFNLHSQTLNSEFIEFVWQFTQSDGVNQIIFKVYDDGKSVLHEGLVDEYGEFGGQRYTTSGIISTKNITMEELTQLRDEVVEYLK